MQRIASACILAITMQGHDATALTLAADDPGVLEYAEITQCEAVIDKISEKW